MSAGAAERERAGRRPFPLVSRRRLVGNPFGAQRSLRRGAGSEIAGSRAYVPGDPVASIDWHASARLSAARGTDEFVVRERYADEAPVVVVVCDRRPSMSLYPPPFPWLSKPAAARAAVEAIVGSASAAGAGLAYLDEAGAAGRALRPYWLPPGGRGRGRLIEARQANGAGFEAPEDTLARSLDFVGRQRADLPAGTFVFVVSDFVAPPPRQSWLRAAAHGWEVVPVVVRDPVWEQSFPALEPGVVPVADPATGRVLPVRISRREAARRRREHEQRLASLLDELRRLRCDPLVLGTSEPAAVDRAFLAWAERRRRLRS